MILDEVKLTADGATYNRLKGWTGVNTGFIRVNPKYGREFSIEPCCNFVATSNNLDALKGLEADDRRFTVYVSPAEAKDAAFYSRIGAVLRTVAEQERLHEFLVTRDLTGFNPMAAAPSFAKGSREAMLAEGLSEAGTWVYEQLCEGGPFADRKYLTIGEVESAVRTHAPREIAQRVTTGQVRDAVQTAGCEAAGQGRASRGRIRVWFGPGLNEAGRQAARSMGSGGIARAAEAEARDAAKAEAQAALLESALGA